MLIVLQIGVLAIQLPIGWAADRMSRSRLLLVTTVLAFVICLLLPHLVRLPLGLWPSLFLLGVATGGVWTVSLALMGEVFRGEQLASALALRSILYGLGAVVGPPIGGLALGAWSGSGLPLMLAAVCAFFALFQIALLRSGRLLSR
jgi:MFS family permease